MRASPPAAATPVASTTITVGPAAQFYTATFSSPVPVNGTFYLGLDSSSNNIIINSVSSGASGTGFYRDQVNGPQNWTQSGLVDRPSYRVSCQAPATNVVPKMGGQGVPQLGATYTPTLSDALPNTFAIIVSGLSNQVNSGAPLPLALPGAPGCDLLVSTDSTAVEFVDAQGQAQSAVPVPNSQALTGLAIFHQWAVWDPSVNALSIVMSDGAVATVGN